MFVWGLIGSTNGRRLIACDCIPIDGQEGAVAVYRQSPAARAMRLTPGGVAVRSIEPARRGWGRVLAITRGSRHAAHTWRRSSAFH